MVSYSYKVTLIDLLDKEIIIREKEYNIQLEEKKKLCVDTDIKKDTTLAGYKTIKNHLLKFNIDKDYRDIDNDDIEEFKYYLLESANTKIGGVITYFKYIKAIFNKLIKNNKLTHNPIQVPSKSKLVQQEKVIFTHKEINTILDNMNKEDSLLFRILLKTGMRLDELCSLKKGNIKNNSFHFYDSKYYFKKIVPISSDILEDVLHQIKTLSDDEYILHRNYKNKYRVNNVRNSISKAIKKYTTDKTVHKTRTTFITYLNYFNSGFSDKDISSITHKLSGVDDKFYAKLRNLDNLKDIINSVDFKNLEEIELVS